MLYYTSGEYIPSFVYFGSIFFILLIVYIIKKKREIATWKYRDILYLYLIYFILQFPLFFLVGYIKNTNYIIIKTILMIFDVAPFFYIFYFFMKKRSLKDFYLVIHRKKDIYLPLLFGIAYIVADIYIIKQKSPDSLIRIYSQFYSRKTDFFFSAFLAVFIYPFMEEIIYRGMLIPSFQERVSNTLAVILSSTIFGLYHCSIFIFLKMFIIGLIFGIIFVRNKTIIPGLILHIILNLGGAYYSFYTSLR